MTGFSVAVTIAANVALVALGQWQFSDAQISVLALGFGILGWVMLWSQPRNGAVWALVWTSVFAGLSMIGQATRAIEARSAGSIDEVRDRVPTDFTFPSNVGFWFGEWAWQPAFMLPGTFAILLFPDGRLPSRRWRWVAALTLGTLALFTLPVAAVTNPTSSYDYSPDGDGLVPMLAAIGFFTTILMSFVCLAGMLIRYRRSNSDTRRQIRLAVFGFVGFMLGAVGSTIVDVVTGGGINNANTPLLDRVLLLSGELVLIAAFGVAIARYRLYDLDVVISKAFTSLVLAVFIAGTYVGLVVGVAELIGIESNLVLSIAATTVVAIAFQPVRRIVQRQANTLVYGDRLSPYDVLAGFGRRASRLSTAESINRVPELIVGGTSSVRATLWRRDGDEYHQAATWPVEDAESGERLVAPVVGSGDHGPALAGVPSVEDPDADRTIPITHDGDVLGVLSLAEARDEPITATDAQVIDNLVSALGLAMRNTRLTARLQAQVVDLERSRQRVLAASDEARRSLERELDGGPQRLIAGIESGLSEAGAQAGQTGSEALTALVRGLVGDATQARAVLTDFAQGVYPRGLEADGLATALADQARRSPLPLTVSDSDVRRYSREVEAAVYFTVLEALQNAVKHAEANSATLTLTDRDDRLAFELRDDGRGFDRHRVVEGAGLSGLADRMDAVGGVVTIDSAPGCGTSIRGSVPLSAVALVGGSSAI
ncbi:MAG: ATP-binding protein [Actinomycetota bacterium]